MPSTDYRPVTEMAGSRATLEQRRMIQTRYREAARIAAGRRVVELACGAGRGLGLLARQARLTVGGDITWPLLQEARRHYGPTVPLVQLDAVSLPFRSETIDVVLLFEAIYYLPDAERCVAECRRVLMGDGTLFICSANRDSQEFVPSALSTRYWSAAELRDLLARHGFAPEVHAAFEVGGGVGARVRRVIKRGAARSGLLPATLSGREWLKRLSSGRLHALGPEVEMVEVTPEPLLPIESVKSLSRYKVIYAWGRLPEAGASDGPSPAPGRT